MERSRMWQYAIALLEDMELSDVQAWLCCYHYYHHQQQLGSRSVCRRAGCVVYFWEHFVCYVPTCDFNAFRGHFGLSAVFLLPALPSL